MTQCVNYNYEGLKMSILFGDFESDQDVFGNFGIDVTDNVYILFAEYYNEDYQGAAWVLFIENDKLYEVCGVHCSCYGLEEQWEPEETSVMDLQHRMDNGQLGSYMGDKNKFKHAMDRIFNILPILMDE